MHCKVRSRELPVLCVAAVCILGGLGFSDIVKTDDLEGGLHPAHPFWPAPHLTLITGHDKHRSRGGSGLIMLEDKWFFSWRRSTGHRLHKDDVVKMAESRDGGRTLENIRVVYDGGVGIDSHKMRLMGNGRIGIFGTRRDSLNVSRGLIPFFIYSDDEGQTWSSVDVAHLGKQWNPSFTFLEYPASVGGHDTDGYMLIMNGNDGYMYAGYTTDNGNTWQSRRLFSRIGGEVSVVRLGETERWIMTCRAANNPVYKTTDLFNWDGPYDSGKQIGNNPSTIVYHNGHVTWIAASRPYHYENDDRRAIPVDGEIFQGIVTCTVDAETVWNDPTDWPDWSILMYLPVHLDPNFVHHQGHWYMLFGAVEGPPSANNAGRITYSKLGIMSSVDAEIWRR